MKGRFQGSNTRYDTLTLKVASQVDVCPASNKGWNGIQFKRQVKSRGKNELMVLHLLQRNHYI